MWEVGSSVLSSTHNIPQGRMAYVGKGLSTAFLRVATADAGLGLNGDSFSLCDVCVCMYVSPSIFK